MVFLIPRLLQDPPGVRDDHRIGRDHECRVGDRDEGVLERDLVDVEAFHAGCLEHVFEGTEFGLGEIFWFLRGEDLEFGEDLELGLYVWWR